MSAPGCIRFVRALRIALFGVPRRWRPHEHAWEIIEIIHILGWQDADKPREERSPIERLYVLQCQTCGDIVKRTVA